MYDLWDDEHDIVHRVQRISNGAFSGWYIVCAGQGPMDLHVGSRRCKAITCLWCIQEIRGPYHFDPESRGT